MKPNNFVNCNRSIRPIFTNICQEDHLLDYFQNSWEIYEWLFSSIQAEESFLMAPDPLRHPLIFYWGHTAAFYINKLVMAGLLKEGINPRFEVLFAKGVDPDRPENLETALVWPDKTEVDDYRQQVYDTICRIIKNTNIELPIDQQHPLWALLMGIEHDRIHFETSSVLIRQLPVELLQRPIGWDYAPTLGPPAANQIIQVEAGTVTIGKSTNSNIYGWDNEYGNLPQEVAPFEATQHLISNAEYLDFFNAGAYNDHQYWTKEGWDWKTTVGQRQPKFWVTDGDHFQYRAMFDNIPLPLDWPVIVNAHEALAYCRWKGNGWRLLTEAEFNLIGHQVLGEGDCIFSDDYNHNLLYGSATPVGYMQEYQKHAGFSDLFGNVWEWLQDDFRPLPGFETHPLYADFSAPYFDTEHTMLAGGAWATTGTAASKYYRLWFRRHFYQHAGFRLARNR